MLEIREISEKRLLCFGRYLVIVQGHPTSHPGVPGQVSSTTHAILYGTVLLPLLKVNSMSFFRVIETTFGVWSLTS